MKTYLLVPLAAFAVGSFAPTAALFAASPEEKKPQRVQVSFTEPERFTDVRENGMATPQQRDYILSELKKYLEGRAVRQLPEGAQLSVRISDVDMAGDFEPWRGPSVGDVRIVKEIYAPRITLSFQLTGADGTVLKQGDRVLSNLNFMLTALPSGMNEPYRHEKALIDDWLRAEFRREKSD